MRFTPSAGPLPHLIDIWRAAAPTLDFISPDIYFPNFTEWADRYVRSGNPLFIPEALRSPEASVNNLYAFGACNGFGFAPFFVGAGLYPWAYDYGCWAYTPWGPRYVCGGWGGYGYY